MTYIKGTVEIFYYINCFLSNIYSFTKFTNEKLWNLGYRYSPRILFSCSGYSPIYKYLCFIEQEQRLYFLKFVFLQCYKYLYLSVSIVFIIYILYYVVFLIVNGK